MIWMRIFSEILKIAHITVKMSFGCEAHPSMTWIALWYVAFIYLLENPYYYLWP